MRQVRVRVARVVPGRGVYGLSLLPARSEEAMSTRTIGYTKEGKPIKEDLGASSPLPPKGYSGSLVTGESFGHVPKPRPRKYATWEEAQAAKREQNRVSRQRKAA